MFLQPPDGNDTRPCVFVDIREGEILEIPPGYWHSSHIIKGPAVVFDIYSGQDFVELDKKPYYQERAQYTSAYADDEIVPVSDEVHGGVLRASLRQGQVSYFLPPLHGYANLAELFLTAPDDHLESYRRDYFKLGSRMTGT